MKRYRPWLLLGIVTSSIGIWPAANVWAADDSYACAMLHKADVQAAFAPREFDAGKPGLTLKSTSTRAAVSSCTYTSRGAQVRDTVTVTLNVRRAPSDETGITSDAAKAGAIQLKASPIAVDGLGKTAYWVNMGSSIQLNVFQDKRVWLVFGSRAKMLDDAVVLEKLTQLAKATLAR